MNIKNVGQNIRFFRRQCRLTQAQLAMEAGVSTGHISHIEIGNRNFSLTLLLKICTILDVTPNDILAGEYQTGSANHSRQAPLLEIHHLSYQDMWILYRFYLFMCNRK